MFLLNTLIIFIKNIFYKQQTYIKREIAVLEFLFNDFYEYTAIKSLSTFVLQ